MQDGPANNAFQCFFAIYRTVLHAYNLKMIIHRTILRITSALPFTMLVVVLIYCWLQTWPSTILVVSHDREFLNTIATDVIHLHSQRIDTYHGDYDTFVKTKTERLKNQQREYEAQKEYREHIQVRLLSAHREGYVLAKVSLFISSIS